MSPELDAALVIFTRAGILYMAFKVIWAFIHFDGRS